MTDKPIPADELIARARRVYAECDTYSDEGEQTTVSVMSDGAEPGGHTSRKTFCTRWKRPDWFFFEFREAAFGSDLNWDRYAIWSTPAGVQSWWTIQPLVSAWSSLDEALGAAAGVSGGTSCFIPELLRGVATARGLPTHAAGYWGERVEIDRAKCLRIPMLQHGGDSSHLCIEESSGLVRRVDEETHFTRQGHLERAEWIVQLFSAEPVDPRIDPRQRASIVEHAKKMLVQDDFREFRTETTTTYRPLLGIELSPESFAFEPPTSG